MGDYDCLFCGNEIKPAERNFQGPRKKYCNDCKPDAYRNQNKIHQRNVRREQKLNKQWDTLPHELKLKIIRCVDTRLNEDVNNAKEFGKQGIDFTDIRSDILASQIITLFITSPAVKNYIINIIKQHPQEFLNSFDIPGSPENFTDAFPYKTSDRKKHLFRKEK